jgi:MFS transporter, UMF1 family
VNAVDTWVPGRRSVAGWVTYDLANTVFALGIQGLYFAIWVTEVQGYPDSALALATAAAMLVVVFAGPLVGARTDHAPKRKPALVATTVAAVGATALLGIGPVLLSLAVYAVALIAFNLGSVVYDALLPDVSTPQNRGWVSGIGVSVGYAGSALAVGAGALLLDRIGYPGLFRTLALMFLVFSLPCFLWLRERPRPSPTGPAPSWRKVISNLAVSWRTASRHPGVVRFLVGRFFYTDAINTLIGGFLVVFAQQEIGFDAGQVQALTIIGIASAIVGGLVAGWLVDRAGPRIILHGVLTVWIATMAIGIAAAAANLEDLGWVVGVAGGLALGATWAADRAYMARLTPAHLYGEFYGLYGTVGRFATILGPLLWALVVDVLGWGRLAALGLLAVNVLIARIVLQGVPRLPARAGTAAATVGQSG